MTTVKEERARVKAKALADYKNNDPLKVIAIRYSVSPATVSLWARAAKFKRRKQGCRDKIFPGETDLEIVAAVKAVVDGKPTLEEIGKHWNMSRANVHRIYWRWHNWKREVPFKPGDKIRFIKRDYEVLKPDVFRGEVRDLKTGEKFSIHWKQGDYFAVKL